MNRIFDPKHIDWVDVVVVVVPVIGMVSFAAGIAFDMPWLWVVTALSVILFMAG